jgi:hypothetical protein
MVTVIPFKIGGTHIREWDGKPSVAPQSECRPAKDVPCLSRPD